MPSFMSKVFGRKKDDRDNQPLGPGELLGGKFEAVSPPVSPTTANYPEVGSDPQPSTTEERDFGFLFFRSKSRPSSPKLNPRRLLETLPALSLDFHELKDKSASNGHIFAELDPELALSDVVIGQRRLNPVEALILIRACSQAITSRGLETLGIMTPHWYSSSPDVQRGLISKFLTSLSPTTAISPSSSQARNFETEVNSTRSIHDVAAVLRWGLRHLQLEGDAFGTDDGWYNAFLDAEAANGYPPKTFSEKLEPSLPKSHLDLLISTLELFSSLAAFSESNSTSGSKLSKVFGLWLLTARRIEDKDDWRTFYGRWERAGRVLEHLFLARIRDQSTDQRMPVRLLELVQKYPYTQGLSSPTADLRLLPRPPFTTALHDALYVRVNYEVASQALIPKSKIHPSALVADALSTKLQEGEYVELWTKITEAASKIGSESPLGNVLANETIHTLSLVADKTKEDAKSPSFSLLSLIDPPPTSTFVPTAKPSTDSAPITTPPLSPIGSNWEQFSASGFLEADTTFPPLASTLFDTDVEKTVPPDPPAPMSRRSSKHAAGRKSTEIARSLVVAGSTKDSTQESVKSEPSPRSQQVISSSNLEIIQLDEAFVDFWSDALLDPIAADWPTFVVCKFKPALVPDLTVGSEECKKTVKWVVLEQVHTVKAPSPPLLPQPASGESVVRPSSPQTPSGRRLFNFWIPSRTPSSSSTASQRTRKTIKTPKVGEMGELVEEDEGRKDTIKVKLPGFKKQKSLDLSSGKQSAEKKSETQDKTKSMEVTKPEISSKIPTIVETNENVAVPGAIVASGAAVVAAALTTAAVVQHYTEKPAESTVQEDLAPKQAEAPVKAIPDVPLPPTLAEVANEDARQVDVPVPEQGLPNASDSEPPSEVLIAEVVAISDIEHPVPEEPSKKELVEVPTKGDDLAVDLPAEVPLVEKEHSVSVPPAVPQVESSTPSNIPAEVMGEQAGELSEVAEQNILLQETVGMKSAETEIFASAVGEKLAVQDTPATQSVLPVTELVTAGYGEEDNVADRLLPVTIDSIAAPAIGGILEQASAFIPEATTADVEKTADDEGSKVDVEAASALVEGVSAEEEAPAVEETPVAIMEEPVAVEGVSTALEVSDEVAHVVSEEPEIEPPYEVLEEPHTAGVTSTLPSTSEEMSAVEPEQVIEASSDVSHTVEAPAFVEPTTEEPSAGEPEPSFELSSDAELTLPEESPTLEAEPIVEEEQPVVEAEYVEPEAAESPVVEAEPPAQEMRSVAEEMAVNETEPPFEESVVEASTEGLSTYEAVESLPSPAEEPTEPPVAGLSAVPPVKPDLESSAVATEEPSSAVASTEELPHVETEPTSGPYPEGELPVDPIERPAVDEIPTTEMESYTEEGPVEEGDKEVFSSFGDNLAGTIEGLSPPDNNPSEELPVVEPAAPAEEEPTITAENVEEESGAAQEVSATEETATIEGAAEATFTDDASPAFEQLPSSVEEVIEVPRTSVEQSSETVHVLVETTSAVPEEAVQVVEETPPVLAPEFEDRPPLEDMPAPVGETSEVEEGLRAIDESPLALEQGPALVEEHPLVAEVTQMVFEDLPVEEPLAAVAEVVIDEVPAKVEEPSLVLEVDSVSAEEPSWIVEDILPVVAESPADAEEVPVIEEVPGIVEEDPAPTHQSPPEAQPATVEEHAVSAEELPLNVEEAGVTSVNNIHAAETNEEPSTAVEVNQPEPALDMLDGDGHMKYVGDETEVTFADAPLVVHKGSEQIENAGDDAAKVNDASAGPGEMGSKESELVTESKVPC